MSKVAKLLDQCTTKISSTIPSTLDALKKLSQVEAKVCVSSTNIPITQGLVVDQGVSITSFTIVGASLTITADQFLVAMTLADNGFNKNIYLPENPKLGETHILKAYTVGGYGNSICNVFANTNNCPNRFDGGYGKGFIALSLMAGLGSVTGGGVEIVYVGNHTWLVVGTTGNVNFRMENP